MGLSAVRVLVPIAALERILLLVMHLLHIPELLSYLAGSSCNGYDEVEDKSI